VPAIRSLDDPTSSTTSTVARSWVALFEQLGGDSVLAYASPSQVKLNPAATNRVLDVIPVVGLVETKVVGTPRPPRRPEWNRVEGRFEPPLIVRVRARQSDGDGDAPTVGEDVSFAAKLCAISWIGSCEAPPFGAFTEALSREAQAHSMPRSWS